jgi:restriction system protein
MNTSAEKTVWGIHAGQTGDADSLFKKQNVIALGWPKMGDLSNLLKDREAFKNRLAEVYPETKPGALPVNTGQLFRFVHEMQVGDYVVYPSKQERKVYIGRVESAYSYQPTPEPTYPHHRSVKWLKNLPRTQFTQGALYEIGSAMSFFQIRNYADEFVAVIEGKVAPPPVSKDETVGLVAEEIEQTTRDFILKRLTEELKGHPFTHFIAHLLSRMGYRTRVSPEGPDGGIDIIAHKDELGFEPPIIKVQVKSGEGSVGEPVVSALNGKLGQGDYGLMITLGTYTKQARNFTLGKSNIRLIDGEELVDLILEHYDQFDTRYKGLLPLRRVFVPEPIEGAEGEGE